MGGPGKTVFTSVIICREGFTLTDQLFFLGWSHTLPATSCPPPLPNPLKTVVDSASKELCVLTKVLHQMVFDTSRLKLCSCIFVPKSMFHIS